MAGLIGTKIGMTSIFGEGGAIIPCTVIQAGPCVVTQIKTKVKKKANPTRFMLLLCHGWMPLETK